jgi:hypothetical protein
MRTSETGITDEDANDGLTVPGRGGAVGGAKGKDKAAANIKEQYPLIPILFPNEMYLIMQTLGENFTGRLSFDELIATVRLFQRTICMFRDRFRRLVMRYVKLRHRMKMEEKQIQTLRFLSEKGGGNQAAVL